MPSETCLKLCELLRQAGIATHHAFLGPHGTGVFTFRGKETAEKAARLIGQAFKIRGPKESIAYNKENKGTCLLPSRYTVYLVGIYGPRDEATVPIRSL